MCPKESCAICPLDFATTYDAYNYAMAHRMDKMPVAVSIPTDAHASYFCHSLALNGVKLFGVWADTLDSTADGLVYTTEAGAAEAMRLIEAEDMKAGIYEPGFYEVQDMTRYFL